MSTKLEPLHPHEYASLFPPMSDEDFKTLIADIKRHGLREPIVVFQDRILDGVHRDKACALAGIKPTYRHFQGDDALAYVVSANLHRRHLDTGQRAMIASKIATLKRGRRGKDAKLQVSRKDAAAALHVSERSVADASVVMEHGAPELIKIAEKGDIPVSTAADLARTPQEEQRIAVEDLPRDDKGKVTAAGKKALKATAKAMPKRTSRPKSGGKSKSRGGKVVPVKPPGAHAFKDAVNHFAAASESLFHPKWMTILEHKGMPDEQRMRLTGYLQSVIQQSKNLQAKLDATGTATDPVERAMQTSRVRERAVADRAKAESAPTANGKAEPTGAALGDSKVHATR